MNRFRRLIVIGSMVGAAIFGASQVQAADTVNQVYFRGGYSYLTSDRGNEVFTSTNGASGFNGGQNGFSLAAGLDIGMTKNNAIGNMATLLGEVQLEYSRFSNATVRQTTSALLGGTANTSVDVSELSVSVSPKVRFDSLGRFRPFLVPVGLAFIVNSPPSNDTSYLDMGVNFGAGLDVWLWGPFSLGVDVRYTYGFGLSDTNTSYVSSGGYVGVNF